MPRIAVWCHCLPYLVKMLAFVACASTPKESLAALASGTRVVVSTAGPFALCGTPLVAACVQAQTDCKCALATLGSTPERWHPPNTNARASQG